MARRVRGGGRMERASLLGEFGQSLGLIGLAAATVVGYVGLALLAVRVFG